MAYNEWDRELQDLFDQTTGTEYLSGAYGDYVEELFEQGFRWHADEYDALGISMDDVYAARQNFFDEMGLPEEEFDWDDWRDYMGYNEE